MCGPFARATLKLQAWSHQFTEIAMSLTSLTWIVAKWPGCSSQKPGYFRLEVKDD